MTRQTNGSTRKAMIGGAIALWILLAGWVVALHNSVAEARELGIRVEASTSVWLAQLQTDILEIKRDLRDIKVDVNKLLTQQAKGE